MKLWVLLGLVSLSYSNTCTVTRSEIFETTKRDNLPSCIDDGYPICLFPHPVTMWVSPAPRSDHPCCLTEDHWVLILSFYYAVSLSCLMILLSAAFYLPRMIWPNRRSAIMWMGGWTEETSPV